MNDPAITEFFSALAGARERVDQRRAEIERLKAVLDDLQEKYAQSESDRLDAELKLERLHQLIERQHPVPERKEDQ